MYQASFKKLTLEFKRAAGTSRGILKTKNSWIISISESSNPSFVGKGEASIIENLSPEWSDQFEDKLNTVLKNINDYAQDLSALQDYPSIRFGIEMALQNLKVKKEHIYLPSHFTDKEEGITINGLIWMGEKSYMLEQIKSKLEQGFNCVKLKIGAIDFEAELELLKYIRSKFSKDTVELRVDANGAFKPEDALSKLNQLALFDIHSIEQPIMAGQIEYMHELCRKTPLAIALDEELIGVNGCENKTQLIQSIKPQYIILKPSLVGGFESSDEWIKAAEENNVGWWITSALESNIGLNAIAQYTFKKNTPMPQGLGTGLLYSNNVDSPLKIEGDQLKFIPSKM